MGSLILKAIAFVAIVALGACSAAPDAPPLPRRHMVVAANKLAAEAGRDVLRAGGSAVDAAIAVQMVLTLVEPQSSGIGGGAFLLHFDRRTNKVEAYDGRETRAGGGHAAAAARRERQAAAAFPRR